MHNPSIKLWVTKIILLMSVTNPPEMRAFLPLSCILNFKNIDLFYLHTRALTWRWMGMTIFSLVLHNSIISDTKTVVCSPLIHMTFCLVFLLSLPKPKLKRRKNNSFYFFPKHVVLITLSGAGQRRWNSFSIDWAF